MKLKVETGRFGAPCGMGALFWHRIVPFIHRNSLAPFNVIESVGKGTANVERKNTRNG